MTLILTISLVDGNVYDRLLYGSHSDADAYAFTPTCFAAKHTRVTTIRISEHSLGPRDESIIIHSIT
jgi:hypothetical protein